MLKYQKERKHLYQPSLCNPSVMSIYLANSILYKSICRYSIFISYTVIFIIPEALSHLEDEDVMASASSTSARNLFVDSKVRLSERVQSNITSIGSLARQIQRGSKSQEILAQTVKNLSSCEVAIESSEASLKRLQVTLAQLQSQHNSVETSCDKIGQVR